MLSGSVSNPRLLGSVLGLGWDCTDESLLTALATAPGEWSRRASEFAATTVADGPLFANVASGSEVDLLAFPVPRWHEGDGGRYIGTGCAVVTRDYDTGRINLGAYRMQVQDEGSSASVNIEAGKHGAQHLRRWFAAEGRAPIAVSLGMHPAYLVAAGVEVPGDVSEYDYVGAMLGAPVRTVNGLVTGLPLPYDAEIAIEGWVRPDNTRPRGPVRRVDRLLLGLQGAGADHRRRTRLPPGHPILLGAPPGEPPHDYSYMRTVMKSAIITDALRVPACRGCAACGRTRRVVGGHC